MKEYDVIVVGAGSGLHIAEDAVREGKSVAVVDKGYPGGVCLNYGCIPTKMMVHPADVVMEIMEAKKHGIVADIKSIDFKAIMDHMKEAVQESRDKLTRLLKKHVDFYNCKTKFIDEYTLDVGEPIRGKQIFLLTGTRPGIPPVKGLDTVPYLTNRTILKLTQAPKSLIIIGGGYIAVELGHFFAAMGTKVTMLQRNQYLVPGQEPEICELLKEKLSQRMNVVTQAEVKEVKKTPAGVQVIADKVYSATHVLVATGRRSNADTLDLEKTGVEVDKRGYIKVDDFFETTKKNIFSAGDAIGRYLFKHIANEEADIAWHNANSKDKIKIDYSAVPAAIFTHPQIASVGLTKEQAKKLGKVRVMKTRYNHVAKGEAMREEDGFVKAIYTPDGKILGMHIIGPHAAILIQEVINEMRGDMDMRIHPALSELIGAVMGNLKV